MADWLTWPTHLPVTLVISSNLAVTHSTLSLSTVGLRPELAPMSKSFEQPIPGRGVGAAHGLVQCFSSGSSYDGSAAQRFKHLPTLLIYKHALIRSSGVPLKTLDGLDGLHGGSVALVKYRRRFAGYSEKPERKLMGCCWSCKSWYIFSIRIRIRRSISRTGLCSTDVHPADHGPSGLMADPAQWRIRYSLSEQTKHSKNSEK